ncbi:MAG: Smr/MutS family protein [Gammaproteobacteria bacterium]|nr:Smr/MutS family protein [Gammaproteobacteria bacterium]
MLLLNNKIIVSDKLTESDKRLFRDSIANLQPSDITDETGKRNIDLNNCHLSDYNIIDVQAEDTLSYLPTSLPYKSLQQIKRGTISINAKLDLHGCNLEEAKQKLLSFLSYCTSNNKKHLLLIHGKGTPRFHGHTTLKSAINSWLKQLPIVLAFHSAKQKHGGTGALYVILKSQN